MERMICLRCQRSVEPIKLFEKSPQSEQWWLITRCPNERCNFNFDCEPHIKPAKKSKDAGRAFWRGDHWE